MLLAIAHILVLTAHAPLQEAAPAAATPPRWREAPVVYADDYPTLANLLYLEAVVAISCVSTPQGSLTHCIVDKATPSGMGFEAVAVKIAERAEIIPAQTEHGTDAAIVTFNLRFTPEPPSDWEGPDPTPDQFTAMARFQTFMEAHLQSSSPPVPGLEEIDPAVRPKIEAWYQANFRRIYMSRPMLVAGTRALALLRLESVPDIHTPQFTSWLMSADQIQHDTGWSPEDAAILRRDLCQAVACLPRSAQARTGPIT